MVLRVTGSRLEHTHKDTMPGHQPLRTLALRPATGCPSARSFRTRVRAGKREAERREGRNEEKGVVGRFLPVALSATATAGLFDAAFSGDWSRIGAITVETESLLRNFCAFVALERVALVILLLSKGKTPATLSKALFGGTISVLADVAD